MLMLVAFVVLLLTVPLAGGRLAGLGTLRLRWPGLVVGALAAQVLIISILPGVGPRWAHAGVHVASYGLIVAFLVANVRVAGLFVVAAGMALNFAAIAANGGVMPASAEALARAGIDHGGQEFENSAAVENPRLGFLGDVFAVPASWPLANVFSAGDVLIVLGGGLVAHLAADSRLARLVRRGRPAGQVAGHERRRGVVDPDAPAAAPPENVTDRIGGPPDRPGDRMA